MDYTFIIILATILCSYVLIGLFIVFMASFMSSYAHKKGLYKKEGLIREIPFIIISAEEGEHDALCIFLIWPLILIIVITDMADYYRRLLFNNINLEGIASYIPRLVFRLGKKLGDRCI